ncbi:MAG: hypothetical protein M3P41_01600 [Actinomycetota bacterium]|nr:hypothetical protein [Actinomycetota bacterium]
MARVLSTAIVLALLAATAVAFAITEGAKLEHSPILRTKVDPVFSPAGKAIPVAHIKFRLRKRERISVWIEDKHGTDVRNVLTNRTYRGGSNLDLVWDGVADDGIVEPDGVYMPVVKLARSHRTIVLPSPIRIDTKPPVITVHHPLYPILSPDGDGRHDSFTVHYTVDERAHGILSVRGRQVEFTRGQKQAGELFWNGKLKGRPARPGRYLLAASAQDEAGNVAKGFPFAIAQIRYLTLARDRVVVRPGGHFALRVSTDYPTVNWRLHGASGVQRRGTLHFRAPKAAGVYRLYVYAGEHAAKCSVVVA